MGDNRHIVFNTIYEQYYRKSILFTKSYVHDDAVAEDIVSESLIKLWETLKETDVNHLQAYLLTLLKNKALDYLRHKSTRESAHQSMQEIEMRELDFRVSTLQACEPMEIFSSEIQTIVNRTLENLSPKTRKTFTLSRFEHKPVKEIAVMLEISPKTVEYHITKALNALRVQLKDYLPLFYFFFYF